MEQDIKVGDRVTVNYFNINHEKYKYRIEASRFDEKGLTSEFLVVKESHPSYVLLVDDSDIKGWKIDHGDCNDGIDLKYLGKGAWAVHRVSIGQITSQIFSNANIVLRCIKCKEANEYAVTNQSNGTFACYSCRSNPLNRLEK